MNLLKNSSDREKFILNFIIFLGGLLSLYIALLRNDLIWPDDHFQALEPASKIVFDRAALSWEWTSGYRSWSLPLFYVPILWLCKLFGISGGLVPIYGARVFNVLISIWSLRRFLTLLEILELQRIPKILTLASFALWPSMLLWSNTCFADHWIMMIWIIITPCLMKYTRSENTSNSLKVGLLAGLPIFFKYQPAILCAVLGVLFLLQRKSFKNLFYFSLGVLTYPLILGILDWIAYGRFASALIEQLSVGEKTSRFYGVSPAYDYFFRITEDLGTVFLTALCLSLLIPLLIRRKETLAWFKKHTQFFSLFALPLIVYFLIHCLIPHKETRLILPIFPLLFILLGAGLEISSRWFSSTLHNHHLFTQAKVFIFEPIFQLILLSLVSGYSLWITQKTPVYLSSVNIASLENEVYQLQKKDSFTPQCLLLLNHHWSWTRGQLILGEGVNLIESTVNDYSLQDSAPCRYAILPLTHLNAFLIKTSPYEWHTIKTNENQFVLLKRKN